MAEMKIKYREASYHFWLDINRMALLTLIGAKYLFSFYLNRGQGWDLVAGRVDHCFAVCVVRAVADLVILPPALLLVLDGVHVVKHRGAVGCGITKADNCHPQFLTFPIVSISIK